jgi:alkyl sulfatase BDS1-like metallo-beta-lactamase superfamily hydrolase
MHDDEDILMAPEEFAALVREASDEDIARGLSVNRELILAGIFSSMPARLNPGRAPSGRFVSEWRITGREDGGIDRWQVVIQDGSCQIVRDGDGAADVTFTVGPVDFVKLVTGNASGPRLFFFGRIKVEGDLLSAARYTNYFRTPRPQP